jgi:hypothetical protein
LDDYSQSGRPSTARTETNIQKVRGLTHWTLRNINGLRCWFEWDFYASSFRWSKSLNLVGTFRTILYVSITTTHRLKMGLEPTSETSCLANVPRTMLKIIVLYTIWHFNRELIIICRFPIRLQNRIGKNDTILDNLSPE